MAFERGVLFLGCGPNTIRIAPPLIVTKVVDDDADGEAEEFVDLAHPLGVALGEIVVDGDHVHTVPGQRVEIAGQGRDEGFALAGLHFRDLARVQDHAADQLHIEVPHVEDAAACFADDRKSLGKDIFENFLQGVVLILFGPFGTIEIVVVAFVVFFFFAFAAATTGFGARTVHGAASRTLGGAARIGRTSMAARAAKAGMAVRP